MPSNYINLFSSNTDASPSIRGIYFQFLVTLEKWIRNYVNNDNSIIEVEVDDDIKEVSDEIILTQVKSYATGFSLNSVEIKKSLLNFYFNYLKYSPKTQIKFCFYTNTALLKSETLLKRWIEEGIADEDFRKIVRKKITEILKELLKGKRKKLLQKGPQKKDKDNINRAYNDFLSDLTNTRIDEFIRCINWEFKSVDPDPGINIIENSIKELLERNEFKSVDTFILQRVLLSEIFRFSKLPKEERVLTKSLLSELLKKSEVELYSLLNNQFLQKILNKNNEFETKIAEIQKDQIQMKEQISNHQISINKVNQLKKDLNLIPIEPNVYFFGRETEMKNFIPLLTKEKYINIHGFYGTGKTIFVKKIIEKYYKKIDHIVWLEYDFSIENIILSNTLLLENLGLPINQYSAQECFERLCSELNNIEGNNVIIVDNYEIENLVLPKLLSLRGWKIIIISKEKSTNVKNYSLSKLEFNELKSFFLHQLTLGKFDNDDILLKLFEKVDFNPLVLKICARTIINSLDLDIPGLLENIENQELDNDKLEIEIIEDNQKFQSVISFFDKKFNLDQLSNESKFVLSFLSILPSDNLRIEDLAMIGGEEKMEVNKKYYVNAINELDRKGWIERENDTVKMPKFLQSIFRYQEQKTLSPFVGHSFHIAWLSHRIKDFLVGAPEKLLRFVQLGESILNSIPHKYRQSIYQPLIILENEVLHAYGVLFNFADYESRWISLSRNAEKYLNSDDLNLGVIYNNLALSYHKKNKSKELIMSLNRAVSISRLNLNNSNFSSAFRLIVTSSNNIIHHLLIQKKYGKAKDKLKSIYALYKSYKKEEDYLFGLTLQTNAQYYKEIEEIDKAIEFYVKAFTLFETIENSNSVSSKNIIILTLINLIYCKLQNNENVNKLFKKIERHIGDIQSNELNYSINLLEALILLYEKVGKYDKASELNKIVKYKKTI